MTMTRAFLAATLACSAFWAVPAAADEAKSSIRASMVLDLVAPRPEASRDVAYDETLRGGDSGPKRSTEPEILPDGSVRYGKTTVTVRNPCPPGTNHYEPLPIPGRRARN
jgi:hypothetical protein